MKGWRCTEFVSGGNEKGFEKLEPAWGGTGGKKGFTKEFVNPFFAGGERWDQTTDFLNAIRNGLNCTFTPSKENN